MLDQISDEDKAKIAMGHCPDCDYRGFVLGPRGGVAINIECGNLKCRARYNVTSYAGTILFAERTDKEDEGGPRWTAANPSWKGSFS